MTNIFYILLYKEAAQIAPERLTINCKRVEIATHQMVFERMWDQKAQRVKGRLEDAQIINRQLDIMQSDIHKHYGLLLASELPPVLRTF